MTIAHISTIDVLQAVRKTLQDRFPGIHVSWRAQAGPDRTRRLAFTVDREEQAPEHFPVLSTSTSHLSGGWRIIVDLVGPRHVDVVYTSRPVFNEAKYSLGRARLIPPSYDCQIAILGCRDWQCAQATLDLFIRKRDDGQDTLVFSSMEYEGEVHTAVLLDWNSTLKVVDHRAALKQFLDDDSAGRFRPPRLQPDLTLASTVAGCTPNLSLSRRRRAPTTQTMSSARSDSPFVHRASKMQTMFSIDTNRNVAALGDQLDCSASSVSMLVALQSLTTQTLQADMAVTDLRQERNQCEMATL
ncbi:hypothetical protein LXA43DRAFT_1105107 [Ganoderma leucocontextum]|nr:hypothetical protein LXA43DRAFT_1105107 [Ganoderma leucocontextum]